MIQNRRYWALPVLLVLAACSTPAMEDEPVEILLGSVITSADTRAGADVPDTQIADQQQIGVYVDDTAVTESYAFNNIAYTADGNGALTTVSPVYYPDNSLPVKISAYHPFYNGSSDTYDFVVSDNQNTEVNYYASDLLYAAQAEYPRQRAAHTLPFQHKLSKVTYTLSAGHGVSGADLEGAEVSLMKPERAVRFNRTTGEVSTPATSQNSDNVKLNFLFGAVVPPQTYTSGSYFVKVILSNGGKYYYQTPVDISFISGEKRQLNITISSMGLSLASRVDDWSSGDFSFEGIKDPPLRIKIIAPCNIPVGTTASYFDGTATFTSEAVGSEVASEETYQFTINQNGIRYSATEGRVFSFQLSGTTVEYRYVIPEDLVFSFPDHTGYLCDLTSIIPVEY